MKRILLIIFNVLLISTSSMAQWIDAGVEGTDSRYALWFNNKDFGWATGSYVVVRTVNGGTSWTEHYTGMKNNWDIQFLTNELGFIVGSEGTEGKILKTTNSGVNWSAIKSTTEAVFSSIFFINQQKGWVGSNEGKIFYTTNSGTDWTEKNTGVTKRISDIWFVSENVGFALTEQTINNKALLKTVNGGLDWTQIDTETTHDFQAIWFADSSNGWIVGEGGIILRTSNGGDSWVKQSSGVTVKLLGVSFATNQVGYASGYNGTILYTENGGETWVSETSGSTTLLYDVFCASNADTYACALGGKVYKKTIAPPVTLPSITTKIATNITKTTATSGGNITENGGAEVTARGVCWSISPSPTVADNKTEDGTGVGEFTSNLTVLTANTKYYVRAYATNSAGTGYGNEVEFTTEEEYSGETVTDIDGNVYPVVEIGTQKWMGKNLKTTKYNDETPIEYPGDDNTAWENNSTGAYAWYDNNETNKAVYGALYNWFAVETSKLCPNEWHVAADDDWKILEAFLGINDAELDETGERGTDEGGMLKETGTGHWANPNTGATNSTGFTAVPSGTRYMSGGYAEKLYWGSIWTSTPSSYPTNAVIRMLSYNDSKITRYTIGGKHAGFAVRCIKNADITPPAISTTTITTITQTTATSGGNITDNGGADVTARGVCWSTSPSPTVADSKTEDGTGVGEFTSNLTGLTTNTKHYVRAYATNSAGTGYGNEVEFTTSNIESFTEPEWVHLNYENSPIPSRYGVEAQEDSKGNIWLASMGSITKYTPEGQMVTYENSAATSDYSSFVLENDNTMWVCNRTDGVFKFDGQGNWTQYNTENTSMTSNYIHSIAIDSKGNKWITTNNGGLVKYDGASWTVYTKENSDLPANSIYSIFIDKNDNVWLGLSGYLVKFDGTTWSIWTSGETDNGVGGVISAIAIDESDNIWIGKDWNLGVAKASLNNLSSWTKYNYGNSDYPESRSVAIDFDADGRVWFGTDSKGLTVFDGSTWYTYNSTNSNWPSNDWVVSIFKDSKENTWLGTHNGFVLIGQYVPTVSTREVSDIMQTSALSGGTIDFYGGADISTKGVVWSTTVSPTLDLNDGYTDNGTGTAEFTSELTNLTAGTTYYLRAYATNSAGTGYDEQIEFTTEEDAPADALPLPFVDGFEEDISHWTIRDDDGDGYSWEISSDDPHSGTKHLKVRWNTDGNNDWLISPLLSFPAGESISLSLLAKSELSSLLESFDVKVISNNGQQIDIISYEVDVPDSYTEFSYDLSSYAGQDVRVAIVCVSVNQYYLFVDDFSCNVTVETAETPTVTTTSISNITQTSASSGGTITSDGGADITVKGVCWSTSASPTITDSKTENGTGISEYSSELTNLAGSTTYYVRAYATNSAGTGYGEQKEFTTTSTGSIIMTTTSLNVYPNPFANNLTIKSDKGIKQIVVTNISGQVVMQKLVNGEISKQINTEKLGSGLYLLQVIDINGNSTHIQLVKP